MSKHIRFGTLLEVAMSKKCTPLWREAHLEVKMFKKNMLGPLFDDSMAIRCPKSARGFGAKHISKSKVLKTAGSGSNVEVWM